LAGDLIELYLNDEFFEREPGERDFLLAPARLSIVYEDENLLVVDKRPGLVVHEDESGSVDTLINRILHYLYEKQEYNPEKVNSCYTSLCNVLDRNTGRVLFP
jgi:23S rRNA pseudouridine955/2504/2580 synthase